jgi:hypothetical protein
MPPRRNIPPRVKESNFCVGTGHFRENLKTDLPKSRSLSFSIPYDSPVLFVESFLFPCQKAIPFIEFSSTVHSTGKSKSATRPKNLRYSALFLRFIRSTTRDARYQQRANDTARGTRGDLTANYPFVATDQ